MLILLLLAGVAQFQLRTAVRSQRKCGAEGSVRSVLIIELARAGEQNAERLTARALAEFGVGNDGSSWRH